MSLFEFVLITFSVLCVVFMVFLWRRGAVDKTKAAEAVKDFADDSRKQFGKWRDELDKK
jgi:hypothetical protein